MPEASSRKVLTVLLSMASMAHAAGIDASAYPSIQAAIDANPGRQIEISQDVTLDRRVRIATPGTRLFGAATLTQANPAEPILEIEHAADVRIEGLTLARAPLPPTDENLGRTKAAGLFINDTQRVTVDGVTLRDAAARDAAIEIRESDSVTVRNCLVLNYQCLAVDDRTESPLYGYAFRCIDGTGILVNGGTAISLTNNRIVEERWLPTRENKDTLRLGALCEGKVPSKPGKLGEGAVRAGYVSNWHQGSAVVVTGPEKTRNVIVQGNQIRNAAQGIDVHADQVIIANNIVDHGMMGVKATHGARNLIIKDNILSHIDLWGILLNPGAASHAADAERPANVDGGTIIAHNVITDYGRGHEYWNWGGQSAEANGSYAIAIYDGQLPENPPLRDVLIEGNIVYDGGRDAVPVEAPRHKYAVFVGSWNGPIEKSVNPPQGVIFRDNILHPGVSGTSNVPLESTEVPKS